MHKKSKRLFQREILTCVVCFALLGLLCTSIPVATLVHTDLGSNLSLEVTIESENSISYQTKSTQTSTYLPTQSYQDDNVDTRNQEEGFTESLISEMSPTEIAHPPRGALPDEVLAPRSAFAPHGIISISDDDAFATQASTESWPGTGLSGDPYIIQNYEIDSDDTGDDCIWIGNTRVHFVIQYCTLIGGEFGGNRFVQSGIRFDNVSNGQITDVTAYDHGECGIFLVNSSFNSISSATCTGNWEGGIRLGYSSYTNTVFDSSCSGNDRGGVVLWGETVRNNTITDNSLTSNDVGVALIECESGDNIISFNTATSNTYHGVSIIESHNNVVINNTCNNNDESGIYLGPFYMSQGSDSNHIANNTCNNNVINGILVDGDSLSNTVETNECNNNEYPIYIDDSNNNTIRENDCGTSVYGIYLVNSQFNILTSNYFDAVNYGVYLETSMFNNITDHTIDSIDYGIFLTGSSNNIIETNTLTGNIESGIYIDYASESNLIEDNFCKLNKYGIYMVDSDYNSIIDCVCVNSTYDGMWIESSSNTSIYENTVTNNTFHGLLVQYSSYSAIVGNLIEHNPEGLRIEGSSSYRFIANNEFRDSDTCLFMYGAQRCVITNNIFNECFYSIRMNNCQWNSIENQTLVGDTASISIEGYCRINTIADNLCQNGVWGIRITGTSYANTLANNTCTGNTIGIYIEGVNDNDIVQNDCSNNDIGIYLFNDAYNRLSKNDCSTNVQGIVLNGSDYCSLTENNCEQNTGEAFSAGITLEMTNASTISLNTLKTNDNGIILLGSNFTSILNNTVSTNTNLGLCLNNDSYNNEIHWNIFNLSDNDDLDNGTDNYIEFNYWSSYTGIDANLDGFGDTPYEIPGEAGSEDPHPLVYKPYVPTWNPKPSGQVIECGERFNYDVDADSTTPIRWWIDNTENFAIDANGIITDTKVLKYGEYSVEVKAYTLYNASCSAILSMYVNDTIAPTITYSGELEYRMGGPHNVNWTVSDLNPSVCRFFKDGFLYDWILWTEETEVLVPSLGYVEVGQVINFTILAVDAAGNTAINTVFVSVLAEVIDTTTATTTTDTTTTVWEYADEVLLTLIVGASGTVLILVLVRWKRKSP